MLTIEKTNKELLIELIERDFAVEGDIVDGYNLFQAMIEAHETDALFWDIYSYFVNYIVKGGVQ